MQVVLVLVLVLEMVLVLALLSTSSNASTSTSTSIIVLALVLAWSGAWLGQPVPLAQDVADGLLCDVLDTLDLGLENEPLEDGG